MTVLPFPLDPVRQIDQVQVVELTDVADHSVHWKVDGYRRGQLVLDFGIWPDFDQACSRARFHARDYRVTGYTIGRPVGGRPVGAP